MSLVRIRRMAQLTLPAEVRRALKVKEGDYLEARVVKDGVLLKPVTVTSRERAWKGILHAVSKVKDTQPDPREDMIAAEDEIAEMVKDHRRQKRKHG